MHVSALIERLPGGPVVYNERLDKIALNNPEEYKIAEAIRDILEDKLEMNIPQEEVGFLSMFLCALDSEQNKMVGIIVLAHGEHTATSMANVVNALLNTSHCHSIDMPLNVKVETVLEVVTQKVKEIDEGKGVLLLVDMGSLTAFRRLSRKRLTSRLISLIWFQLPLY